jgi:hypothetical protein
MKAADRDLRVMLADVIETGAMDLLDPDRLQAIAEDLRLVERRRGYDAGLVAVSLVLSALQRSTDTQGRLVDARRVYEMLGGGPTREAGFRKVARKVGPVLSEVLRRRLTSLAAGAASPELRGRLSTLRDVLIPDGCAFKLANMLASQYPGTGQASEMKLHAVYSVRHGGLVSLEESAGSVHDNDRFAPAWLRGALYIWDLGYNDYRRVVEATKAGALVLQRLKAGANPKAVASYGEGGHRRELHHDDGSAVGLEEACALGLVHKQRVLDLDVELGDKNEPVTVRVVCVPFGGEDRYYLTTLPREKFSPHDVAEIYRLRWEIELFFRGLKGAVRLDEVRRLENPASLHAVVYGTLLAAVLARDITAKLNEMEAASALAKASAEAFPPGAPDGVERTGRNPSVVHERRSPRGPVEAPITTRGPAATRTEPGSTIAPAAPADLLRRRLAARAHAAPPHRPAARHTSR